MAKSDGDIIFFNVGGICYTTSRDTLENFSDSRLGRMLSGRHPPPDLDRNGLYFIDRDGKMFRYIINYMRDQELYLPSNFKEYDQLLAEAEFFMLPEMKEEITSRLNKPYKKEVVLLRNYIVQDEGVPTHICAVEAEWETWEKLKSLKSAGLETMSLSQAHSQLHFDRGMTDEIYPGNLCRSIIGHIVKDGFKLECTTRFHENSESFVFSAKVTDSES